MEVDLLDLVAFLNLCFVAWMIRRAYTDISAYLKEKESWKSDN